MTDMGLETFESQNKISNTFRLVLFDEEKTSGVNHVNINSTNVELVTSKPLSDVENKLTRRRRNVKTSDFSQYDKVRTFLFYWFVFYFIMSRTLSRLHSKNLLS